MNENIISNIDLFMKNAKEDSNHRFLSWEHCHNEFLKYKNTKTTNIPYDLLALHLAFYLASWGMYRGSSFLLQFYDYKIHIPAVQIALEYPELFDINPLQQKEKYVNLLFGENGIYTRLNSYYSDLHQKALNKKDSYSSSNTLITKILLGIYGCIPAYDINFKKTLSKLKIKQTKNNLPAIESLIDYINENQNILDIINKKLKTINRNYTIMKIIDMAFWQNGANL